MNHKHGDKVIVYKFFQGVFTKEYGEKRINPYGKEGKFLGIIGIVGEKHRSVQCSTKPGVIRNNFVWYPADEKDSELKALKIFKARENILLYKAEIEIETRIEHEKYLDSFIKDYPEYSWDPEERKKIFGILNKECERIIQEEKE